MPTENRSSNTEMVSVPREPTAEMLAAAKKSGVIDPRVSGYCYALMVAAAPTHQGEPVATVQMVDPLVLTTGGLHALKVGDKLYTHADPGEVERANSETMAAMAELAECESMADMVAEREWAEHVGTGDVSSKVEAAFTQLHNDLHEAGEKLAEREALLRKVREPLDLRAEFDPTYPENTVPRNDCAEAVKAIDAALSASAEPSAPVERDERAEFESALRSIASIPGDSINYHATHMSRIARAALERKP